jgi:predicted nicotinamide N-methyase
LGAGLGLCGILAHHLGARQVILTDGDSDTLALLRENVATNVVATSNTHDNKVECRQLRWGHEFATSFSVSIQACFDIILASDVIYVEECIEPLMETVVALLAPSGVFCLSYARRNVSIDKVLCSAEQHGLSWTLPNEAAEGVHVFFTAPTCHQYTYVQCEGLP